MAYIDKIGVHIVDLENFTKETIVRYVLPSKDRWDYYESYYAVFYSPNSKFLALYVSRGEVYSIEIYDIDKKELHDTSGGSIYCAPNGRLALIGGYGIGMDCGLFWGEADKSYEMKAILYHSPLRVVWSPRGDKLAVLDAYLILNTRVRVYNYDTKTKRFVLSTEIPIYIDIYISLGTSLSSIHFVDNNNLMFFYSNGLREIELSPHSSAFSLVDQDMLLYIMERRLSCLKITKRLFVLQDQAGKIMLSLKLLLSI